MSNLERLILSWLLALSIPAIADPAIHYAPAENLEHIDVALIDTAKHEIDFAAYVLTDWPVMQALARAANRGVKVRIYLDGTQLGEREPSNIFNDLAETPGVEIRIKRVKGAPMHLKSYEIDGRLLRTGAANFSASGEKRQDNDLVVIENADAAAAFKHNFDLPRASHCRLALGNSCQILDLQRVFCRSSHSATPPWREHVPVICCEYEYSPSRHLAVAPLSWGTVGRSTQLPSQFR